MPREVVTFFFILVNPVSGDISNTFNARTPAKKAKLLNASLLMSRPIFDLVSELFYLKLQSIVSVRIPRKLYLKQ